MILGSGVGIGDAGRAAVDGSIRSGADVELGELVEFNIDIVLRVALTLSLDLPRLYGCQRLQCGRISSELNDYLVEQLGRPAVCQHSVGEAECR